MSEEQLSAFLAAVKADAELQDKLKGAADLDAAVAIAKEAGFDVSKADWIRYQAKQTLELSDEELEAPTGGVATLCDLTQQFTVVGDWCNPTAGLACVATLNCRA
jgi:predicted ribosomally synthesized peptide with nif11-like leader